MIPCPRLNSHPPYTGTGDARDTKLAVSSLLRILPLESLNHKRRNTSESGDSCLTCFRTGSTGPSPRYSKSTRLAYSRAVSSNCWRILTPLTEESLMTAMCRVRGCSRSAS